MSPTMARSGVTSSSQNTEGNYHSSDLFAAACHQSDLCHNVTLVAPGVRLDQLYP
jgi:hypothetical protein